MTSSGAFHVVLCADHRYLRPTGITVASLLRENPDLPLVVHLLCDELPDAERDRFAQLVKGRRAEVRFHMVDPRAFADLPLAQGYPRAIFYRLLAPELVAGETDRLLYLDGDVLCMGSIRGLVELDLSQHVMAAVPDVKGTAALRTGPLGLKSGLYFNSGVLLINVPRWLEEKVSERVVDFLAHRNLLLPDQDALNVVLEGRVLPLDRAWNRIVLEGETVGDEPVNLRHFADRRKPWKLGVHPPHVAPYHRVYRESPWGDIPLDRPVTRWHRKQYAMHLLGTGHLLSGIGWYVRYSLTRRARSRGRPSVQQS